MARYYNIQCVGGMVSSAYFFVQKKERKKKWGKCMDLLFIDLETGGLDSSKHSLLQIGMAAYIDGRVKETLSINISLEEYIVTAEAMRYNKINLEELHATGLPPDKAFLKVRRFISRNFPNGKPILAGYNLSLDKAFITKFYNDNEIQFHHVFNHRMFDLMGILWYHYMKGNLPIETCTGGCFNYFDAKIGTAHNALDDVLSTIKLFEKLMLIGPDHLLTEGRSA
jgi:DNA polymerase III epsilon subunit-like protein